MSDKPPPLPAVLPGGQITLYMSSKARHNALDTVFHMLGGAERLHKEANRSSDSYWEFMKLWGKGLPRAAPTEAGVSPADVEAMLEKLDRAENAVTINGKATEVTDVEDEES